MFSRLSDHLRSLRLIELLDRKSLDGGVGFGKYRRAPSTAAPINEEASVSSIYVLATESKKI